MAIARPAILRLLTFIVLFAGGEGHSGSNKGTASRAVLLLHPTGPNKRLRCGMTPYPTRTTDTGREDIHNACAHAQAELQAHWKL